MDHYAAVVVRTTFRPKSRAPGRKSSIPETSQLTATRRERSSQRTKHSRLVCSKRPATSRLSVRKKFRVLPRARKILGRRPSPQHQKTKAIRAPRTSQQRRAPSEFSMVVRPCGCSLQRPDSAGRAAFSSKTPLSTKMINAGRCGGNSQIGDKPRKEKIHLALRQSAKVTTVLPFRCRG